MAKQQRLRIVIADGARARILDKRQEIPGFDMVNEFDSMAAHARSRDLVTDRPGRGREITTGYTHPYAPASDPHREEKLDFAKLVADAVNQANDADEFDALILVAPERILGPLRDGLAQPVCRKLVAEVQKDLTRTPVAEVEEQLADHLRAYGPVGRGPVSQPR